MADPPVWLTRWAEPKWANGLKMESRFSIGFYNYVIYWALKIHCIDILNIFLIYFKT